MQIKFPLQIDGRGRTSDSDDDTHIREMIEQILFTAPGERPNRPTFGTSLLSLALSPAGDALCAAAQVTVQGALQQWLGDQVSIQQVSVSCEDATVKVTVQYVILRTQQQHVAEFSSQNPAADAAAVTIGG